MVEVFWGGWGMHFCVTANHMLSMTTGHSPIGQTPLVKKLLGDKRLTVMLSGYKDFFPLL